MDELLTRFRVQFETNSAGTTTSHYLGSLEEAKDHAVKVTTDGRAPSEARVWKERRETPFSEWEIDRSMRPFDVIDGELEMAEWLRDRYGALPFEGFVIEWRIER